ncbi:hypothetical protein NC651_035947 [Populus alba x Populus x berolinensis]|nr:hypothetical protein NC651_035947 [Populus alba x Populus x berolinensis]
MVFSDGLVSMEMQKGCRHCKRQDHLWTKKETSKNRPYLTFQCFKFRADTLETEICSVTF